MKKRMSFPLAALLMCAAAAAEGQQEFPGRRPGLWELKIGSQDREQISKQCIDAGTDARMREMGGQIGQMCRRISGRLSGDSYVSESECRMAGSLIHSKAAFQGDLSCDYRGEIVSTFTPPLMGQSGSTTSLKARWIGACPAGMKPGDALLPNGAKVNILQPQPPGNSAD